LACDVALDGGSPALNSSWLLRLGVAAVAAASAQLRLGASLGWGLSAASALAVAIVVVLSDGQVRPKKKELAQDAWSGARACCGNRSGLLELLASVRREQGYGGVHERTKLVLDACSVERQELEIERENPGASLGGHGLLARLLKFLGKRNGQEN